MLAGQHYVKTKPLTGSILRGRQQYECFFHERPDFQELFPTIPPGDITKLPPEAVPSHDILLAGFPCQPFSLAGVSKKKSLGRPHGFDDPTQGTLFFNVKEIIRAKQPRAFLLENVKNLQRHDGGRTFRVIRDTLENELGYVITHRIIDAQGWVPQHRERIFIVGYHPDCCIAEQEIEFPRPPKTRPSLGKLILKSASEQYTLGPGTWKTLVRHKAHHARAGNGFGYGLIARPFRPGQVTRTISARYHKDGAEVLIDQPGGVRPRRLTPLECARLMGFPEEYTRYFDPTQKDFRQPVSDTQAYRQFGNSVVVPVVAAIAKAMIMLLDEKGVESVSIKGPRVLTLPTG